MDQQTLEHITQGDPDAFLKVVEQYQKPLFAYLGRMGVQQAIAEELVQEVFIRAWKARESFNQEKSSYSTWLFTIARRLTLNELDKASRRHEKAMDEHNTEHKCIGATPFEKLQQEQQHGQLSQALRQLTPHDRSLLALAYFHDLKIVEIAAIEDIAQGTVKSRLHRIRENLKSKLRMFSS